jgi:Ca2+ transporting ATPase
MENAFAKSTSEVLKFFQVSEAHGLTEAQVSASREKHGRNGRIDLSSPLTTPN